ncbi:MAG TPA: hypothetical protein VEN81_03750 [Planctomycetota bacterium]|nr:hypothetical protein [Planctomycetota bacterium]
MMREWVALAFLGLGGCASNCQDGWGKPAVLNDATYHTCDFECCRNEKSCGCSKTCPCWNQSKHPKP